jgi:uncharacterized integral membrane protein (TIGR00698 family)
MRMIDKKMNFISGMTITFIISLIAKALSFIPGIAIVGQLVLALILGMLWRSMFRIKKEYSLGVDFSSKSLLRLGIILLGMRLNLLDIYHAGISVFLIALINLLFALIVVYMLTRWLGVEKKIGLLTACGTAICGAAAIVALAPQLKANQEEISTSVAVIAVLGTIFTIGYTFIYSLFGLTPIAFGIFSGATLHEIAHVIAAADVGNEDAVDMAVIVKLTRVMLLVPVAIVLSYFMKSEYVTTNDEKKSSFPVPWFIVGFLVMSGLTTLNILPETVSSSIVSFSYILLAMAMAGFGLNVNIKNLLNRGKGAFIAGLIGSILLSLLGYGLVVLFYS